MTADVPSVCTHPSYVVKHGTGNEFICAYCREPAPKVDVPAALTLVDRLDMAATTAYGADSALCDEAVALIRSLQATVNSLNEANHDLGTIAQENIELQAENDRLRANVECTGDHDDFFREAERLRERLATTEAVAKELKQTLYEIGYKTSRYEPTFYARRVLDRLNEPSPE